jgi:hypothetical protein
VVLDPLPRRLASRRGSVAFRDFGDRENRSRRKRCLGSIGIFPSLK